VWCVWDVFFEQQQPRAFCDSRAREPFKAFFRAAAWKPARFLLVILSEVEGSLISAFFSGRAKSRRILEVLRLRSASLHCAQDDKERASGALALQFQTETPPCIWTSRAACRSVVRPRWKMPFVTNSPTRS